MRGITVYSEAIRIYREKNPGVMGKKSGAVFDPINGRFILDYFGTAIEVHYPSGQINSSDPVKMSHNDMVLVLQYLSGFLWGAAQGKLDFFPAASGWSAPPYSFSAGGCQSTGGLFWQQYSGH